MTSRGSASSAATPALRISSGWVVVTAWIVARKVSVRRRFGVERIAVLRPSLNTEAELVRKVAPVPEAKLHGWLTGSAVHIAEDVVARLVQLEDPSKGPDIGNQIAAWGDMIRCDHRMLIIQDSVALDELLAARRAWEPG